MIDMTRVLWALIYNFCGMNKFMKSVLLVTLSFSFMTCQSNKERQAPVIAPMDVMPVWDAELFYEIHCQLGEGAIWNYETQELWFIDIEGMKFHTLSPKGMSLTSVDLDQRIGTVVPSRNGQAILALEDGVYGYDFNEKSKTLIANPLSDQLSIRLNDGKCDPMGRLWVGSMGMAQKPYRASLYTVESNGNIEEKLDSITISNGIVWSENHETMYYIDTPDEHVKAFDYDVKTGAISNGRVVIEIDGLGFPDGMTIDAEGMLWIGLWNGNIVGRYNPITGKLIGKVEVPAHNITSCAFGGEELDTLFITTASLDMTAEELKAKPLSGSVFSVVPGVKGVKSDFFKND